MQEIPYIGNELELFEQATVWKRYYGRFITPFLKGKVLEVGAGIGGTTSELCNGTQEKWVCLEPDPVLYAKLVNKIQGKQLPACCSSIKGTTDGLPEGEKYNALMYIDVIEHIEDDAAELRKAAGLLANGGYLIVLVPAHQSLYTAFDKAIGHYRRYDRQMLLDAAPAELRLVRSMYLDSCGLLASLANKYFLKQGYPTIQQIKFWSRYMVPVSKITDFIFNYHLGKTVVAIWQKK